MRNKDIFVEKLRSSGLRPTKQRIQISELLFDRKNTFHVVGYITLLLSYTGILVSKILYAKEEWHNEFNDNLDQGSEQIDKMSDYQDQLNVKDETDTKR